MKPRVVLTLFIASLTISGGVGREVLAQAEGDNAGISAFERARTAVAVYLACDDGKQAVQDACAEVAATTILEFVEDPTSAKTVPGRKTIEDAFRAVRRAATDPGVASGVNPWSYLVTPGDGTVAGGGGLTTGAVTAAAAIAGPTGLLTLSSAELALGAADFLLERGKQELVHTLLLDLRKLTEDHGDLEKLFGSTWGVLDSAESMPSASLAPMLVSSFRSDLRALPLTMSDPELELWKDSPPDTLAALKVAGQVLEMVDRGRPAALALAAVGDSVPDTEGTAEFRQGLKLAGALAREFHAARNPLNRPGLPQVEPGQFIANSLYRDAFLVFLLHDLGRLEELDEVRKDYAQLTELWDSLAFLQASIEDRASTDGGDGEEATGARRVAAITSAVSRVFQAAGPLLGPDAESLQKEVAFATGVWMAVERKDYPAAAQLALRRITEAFSKGCKQPCAVPHLRLLSVGSALLTAKDGTELEAALAAAADPVGGFRARRTPRAVPTKSEPDAKVRFSIALNSYLGGRISREWVPDDSAELESLNTVWAAGAAAPIGVDLRWALDGDTITSWGIFFSFIDVGNAVNYRLSSGLEAPGQTGVEAVPEFDTSQLFAPGAHLVFGVTRRYPLSVGLGFDFVPNLRTIEGTDSRVNSARFGAFIAIDLTLLRF